VNIMDYGTYLTAIAIIQNCKTNQIVQARILIDPGTARSYITEPLPKYLP